MLGRLVGWLRRKDCKRFVVGASGGEVMCLAGKAGKSWQNLPKGVTGRRVAARAL